MIHAYNGTSITTSLLKKIILILLLIFTVPMIFLFFVRYNTIRAEGPIEFTDASDLHADFDDLAANDGKLDIEIHNYANSTLSVQLHLGEVPEKTPSGQATQPSIPRISYVPVWKKDDITRDLYADQTDTFTLELDISRRPEEGIYEHCLEAICSTSEKMDYRITRKLFIEVKRPEDVSNKSIKYQPDKLDSLAFIGVNYIPSILNPLGGFFLFVAIISFVLWVALNLGYIMTSVSNVHTRVNAYINPKSKRKKKATNNVEENGTISLPTAIVAPRPGKIFSWVDICLWVFATFLITFIIFTVKHVDFEPAIVRIKKIPVAATGGPIVGQIVDSQSELGSIIQIGDELGVLGVRKAGQYTGSTSFPGGNNIDTTVSVSDFWLFSFFTIAGGVILGYFITWYYSVKKDEGEKEKEKTSGPPSGNNDTPRSKRIHDWQVAAIVGLLAIGSGYATLYFKNAYWGSYLDYLIAFLWGAIGSQGLKYIGNIINRLPPTG